jgi:N-acetylglucosamine kinase-like BadF-type ATPase
VLLVAVDAGGSSTRAVVLDASGRCLGVGTAGSGNPISAGPDSVVLAVGTAVGTSIAAAGVSPADVVGGSVAMAGASGREHPGITAGLAAAGVGAPYVVESDLLAMYCAGTLEPDGYGLVAGTGAAAIRVRGGAVETSADGMGWLLGDEGSGYWIGHQVARAVVADLDGRGRPTALTPLLLDSLGVDAVLELVHLLYADRPVRLAGFAPLAFAAGDDPVAATIVEGASRALAHTLASVLAEDVDGPLVLGGSVLLHQASVAAYVADSSGARHVRTVADGLAGAASLALRHHGITVDPDVFDRIATTLANLR